MARKSKRTPNHHRTGLIGQDYPIDPYRADLDKAYDPYDRDWRTGNPPPSYQDPNTEGLKRLHMFFNGDYTRFSPKSEWQVKIVGGRPAAVHKRTGSLITPTWAPKGGLRYHAVLVEDDGKHKGLSEEKTVDAVFEEIADLLYRSGRARNPSRPPALPNLQVGDIVTIEDEGGWRTVPYELRVNKVMTTRFEAGRVPFNSYTLREITSGRHGSVSTVVAVNGDPVKGRPTRVRNGDASALADLIAERDFAAMQHRYGANSRAHDRYEDEHHALTAMIGGRSGRRGKRTRNGGLDGFDLYKEFADEIGTMADRHSILHKYAPSLHKIALSQVGQTGDTPYEQALKNQVLCLWQFLSRHLLPDVAEAVGCDSYNFGEITELPPAFDRESLYEHTEAFGRTWAPQWQVSPPDGEASRALDKRLEQMRVHAGEALRQAYLAVEFLERYDRAVARNSPNLEAMASNPLNLRPFRELPIVAAYAVESAALARVPLKVLERAMREGL